MDIVLLGRLDDGKFGSLTVCAFLLLGTSAAMASPTLTTLVNFDGADNGANPDYGSLLVDGSGNLYGTTSGGGSIGYGTVFKVAAGSNTLSTLVTFNATNGSSPYAGLIADGSGNLYGTTYTGGSSNDGTVFKIAAGSNTLGTLATFTSGKGTFSFAGVVADGAGNLYGTTYQGGSSNDGTVFKVAVGTNALTTLVTFNGSNGEYPAGNLIADSSGNLYGTTSQGGSTNFGTIFKIAAGTTTRTTLLTFNNTDGAYPQGNLIFDSSGNLYGTTYEGGPLGDGTVFKFTPGTNVISTVATFNDTDGEYPLAGLIADAAGNLYGTTDRGGPLEDGTVFKIVAGSKTISTIALFDNTNGSLPFGGLTADSSGDLYGTTNEGGSGGDGTVFELTGTGFVTVPEPAGWALAGVGALALLHRRRPSAGLI